MEHVRRSCFINHIQAPPGMGLYFICNDRFLDLSSVIVYDLNILLTQCDYVACLKTIVWTMIKKNVVWVESFMLAAMDFSIKKL